MTEAKHTPGPWLLGAFNNLGLQTVRGGPSLSPVCLVYDPYRGDEAKANARLIAAAPEMLEALKAVIAVADRKTVEFDAARAAIAKAEGRS